MLNIVKDIQDAKYVTHSGTMHADEVFATAFLELYKHDIDLLRTSSINADDYPDLLIYDIGRGKFDHHMNYAPVRENGIKYSSFGLLWREFGKDFLSGLGISDTDEVFNYFDKDLVEGIDAIDNGTFPRIEANYRVKTLSDIIKLFNNNITSSDESNKQFIKAEDIAKTIIKEEINSCITKIKTKKLIESYLENSNDRYLILDEYLPYEEFILSSPRGERILYVIYPSTRGGYAIKTVPVSSKDHSSRLPFPKEWSGLSDNELEEVSGIPGLTFCHSNLFIATCKDKETAIAVVKKIIKENEDQ
ncbi:MAG: MYG1 family protein [Bacilli bacterium]|nr:MYG1 family protein [Bacilli bacterium]